MFKLAKIKEKMNAKLTKLADIILPYWQLMRGDKPIGTVLLMCPMLWALWLATDGNPPADVILIFLMGAYVMRGAGCVINDFADRKIDKHVKRTLNRPLTSGRITSKKALYFFVFLIVLALCLMLLLPPVAWWGAVFAFVVTLFYPFSKRFFIAPQAILGLAFSASIPMVFLAIDEKLTVNAILLFFVSVLWTVVYDTFYAMVDRDDDKKLNLYSSAIWFADNDLKIIQSLMIAFLVLMMLVGLLNGLRGYYYLGLLLASICFIYQIKITQNREREYCFIAFLNNQWVGVLIWLGIVLSYQAN